MYIYIYILVVVLNYIDKTFHIDVQINHINNNLYTMRLKSYSAIVSAAEEAAEETKQCCQRIKYTS